MMLLIKDWINVPTFADGLAFMQAMPPRQVDLAILDLPWSQSNNEWDMTPTFAINWGIAAVKLLSHVLNDTGSVYIMCGYRKMIPKLVFMLERIGFTLQNWIIWRRDLGYHTTKRYKTRGVHILFATSHPKHYTFNGDAIRMPHRTSDLRNNPMGAIPSDVWTSISELRKNSIEYTGHRGQKPEALYERIIKASSNVGDLVLDPCAGTFTIGAVAGILGRRWIACDNAERWVKVGCTRLSLDYYYALDN